MHFVTTSPRVGQTRDQLQNPTLGNRVWATFTFLAVDLGPDLQNILRFIIRLSYDRLTRY